MRLIDGDGHGIELGVVGFQFPDSPVPGKRHSWLIIEGRAVCPQGSWTFRWQALTATEAVDFADWLRETAEPVSGTESSTSCTDFLEPNLAFAARADAAGDHVNLKISLDLEFSPPWRRHSRAGDPFEIWSRISRRTLSKAAQDWASEIAPYPPLKRSAP